MPARLAALGLLLLTGSWSIAQQPLPPLPAATGHVPAPAAAPAPLPALPSEPPPPALPVGRLHYSKAKAPALPTAADIRQTRFYQDVRPPVVGSADQLDYLQQLLPPNTELLFSRFQPEDRLREQIRQESKEKSPPERAVFPDEKPVTQEPYAERRFSAQVSLVEPAYVNYKRLYFEDVNSERYGWDKGMVQPVISAGLFFLDVAVLPYQIGSRPFNCVDSSAGYCLPGDPVPYLLYPPNLSVTGAMAETGAFLGAMAIFP